MASLALSPEPTQDLVVVHHDGSFLEWSCWRSKPVTTGMPRAEMRKRLMRTMKAPEADAVLDRAALHGTSWSDPADPRAWRSADAVMADNCAGGFDEHIHPDEIVCRLLMDREPLR